MVYQNADLKNPGSFDPRRRQIDPCRRRMLFGPVRAMEEPGLLRRLLGG
ncbi:MAG: hypothetical protein J7496_15345 [Novosphingobium sp.]|nr:hypothetical protein [Novosphingobium sp.]MBO9603876.1 hypothetical protein [Novosphingobium sp.]